VRRSSRPTDVGEGEERLGRTALLLVSVPGGLVVVVDRLVAGLLALPLLLVGQRAGLEGAGLELLVELLDAQVVLELVVGPASTLRGSA